MYESDIRCKLAWYFSMVAALTSIFTLLLIAIDRYRKVCRPFGKQMRKKKLLILLITVISAIISAPCFMFYGKAPVESSQYNLIGHVCTSVPGGRPNLAMAFYAFIFFIIVAELITMAVLYFFICRVIFRKPKFGMHDEKSVVHSESSAHQQPSDFTVSVVDSGADKQGNYRNHHHASYSLPSNEETIPHSHTKTPSNKYMANKKEHQRPTSGKDTSANSKKEIKSSAKSTTSSPVNCHVTNRKVPRYRISLVFVVITIVFAISFIPKAIVMFLDTSPDFMIIHPDLGLIFRFLNTTFIINNFVNPIIYGIMDKQFKQEVKRLFCCRRNVNEPPDGKRTASRPIKIKA